METLNIFIDKDLDTSASIFTTDDVEIETAHDYINKYSHTNPELAWSTVPEVGWKKLASVLNIDIEITGGKARRAIDKAAEILAGGKKLPSIATAVPTQKSQADIVAKAEEIKQEISNEAAKALKRQEFLERAMKNVKAAAPVEEPAKPETLGETIVRELELEPATSKTVEPAPVKHPAGTVRTRAIEASKDLTPVKEEPVQNVDKMAQLGTLFSEILGINNRPQADTAQMEEIAMTAASKMGQQVIEKVTEALNIFSQKINEQLGSAKSVVEVKKPDFEAVKVGHTHKMFEEVLTATAAGIPLYLVGVSGSGKTHACKQVAEGLELNLSTLCNPTKEDIKGVIEEYVYSANILIIDNLTDLSVLDYLNSALAKMDIHSEFAIIITSRIMPTDPGAFVVVEFGIDEALELAIAPNDKFTKFVQKARKEVGNAITPNASINGGKLINAGWKMEAVINSVLKAGLPDDLKIKIDVYPKK